MHEFVAPVLSLAAPLWQDVLSQRHLDVVRKVGALSLLPLALASRAIFDIHSGDLAAAGSLVAESQWVAEVTGGENTLTPIPEAWLAAMRGHEQRAERLIHDTLHAATALGQGVTLTMIYSARAVLCNGLGRYEDALAAAREAAADPLELGCAKMTPPKSSTGRRWSGSVGPRSAWSLPARSSFMVNGCAGGRRVDARAQLRTAHEELTAMGAEAFADRARRELTATGETVHRRTMQTQEELTDQEAHIARLAAEGLTNTEIAAALYLSPRTVEWHLRKIFAKLGVSTRRQLRRSTYADPKGTSG